jgi:type II secretory pathway component GspD/PulD (secretin)
MNAPRVVAAIIALSALSMAGCKSGTGKAEDSKAAKPADKTSGPAVAKGDKTVEKPGAAPAAAKPGEKPATPTAKPADTAAAKPAEKPAEKPAPAPAKPADTAAAKPAEKPADKPATAAPAPAAGSPAAQAIGPLAREKEILKQQRETLIKSYTELGDKAYAESRFEDAETMFGNVLDLDPKNAHARDRLDAIGALLGKRPMDQRNALNDSVENYKVRVQQAKVEVANLSAQAENKAKTGNYDAATALYDKALVIAGLYPANVDFSPSVEGLKALRDGAKKSAADAAEMKRRQIQKEAADQTATEAAKQRAARKERTKTLFAKANQAMERNDYQTARNLAEEILAGDPTNTEAKRLRRIAVDAQTEALDDKYKNALLDEWKSVFEQLSEAYAPQTDDYTFPSSWDAVQNNRKPPALSSQKRMEEDPQSREIMNRLTQMRTTVHFTETRIDGDGGAIDYLHRISGVNIVMLPAAKEGKSDADLTIESLSLDQPVSVKQILDIITGLRGLAWNIENGVVQITTPQAAQGAFIVQLYDVKDIATPIANFPGEEVNLDPKGEHQAVEEAKEPVADFVLDSIGELINNNVDKSVWEGGGTVEAVPPGTLVVKCPAATHVKVQQLLDGLRGAGGLQVSIETRFLTVKDNFLQDVGVDMRGLGDNTGGQGVPGKGGIRTTGGVTTPVTFDDVFFGSPGNPSGGRTDANSIGTGNDTGIYYQISGKAAKGDDIRARFENLYDVSIGKPGVLTDLGGLTFQGTYLDDAQLEAILHAVEKSDRSTTLTAPRLTAYNGQRANVTVLNQVSYIADFDVEIAQASQIGDPIVQTLRDGVILDLRPVVSADRRFITMELRPTVAILARPIQTFQTTLANGPPVTIQLFEIAVQRVRTTVTMPDGGTLLLGGLRFLEEKRLDSSVPWLNEVPFVSFLLSRKGTFLEKRNLLVLIRARILRPEENEPGVGRKL